MNVGSPRSTISTSAHRPHHHNRPADHNKDAQHDQPNDGKDAAQIGAIGDTALGDKVLAVALLAEAAVPAADGIRVELGAVKVTVAVLEGAVHSVG